MSGRRLINLALKNIREQQQREHNAAVREHQEAGRRSPNYATGLASEGYVGGYRDALSDVILAMNGVRPDRRGWWENKP